MFHVYMEHVYILIDMSIFGEQSELNTAYGKFEPGEF